MARLIHTLATDIRKLGPRIQKHGCSQINACFVPNGLEVRLRLRDAGRPGQTGSRNHPLSGCATVDWSDAPSRPKVPPNGVFDNILTLRLASGEHTFFLSEEGRLNQVPDAFDPG